MPRALRTAPRVPRAARRSPRAPAGARRLPLLTGMPIQPSLSRRALSSSIPPPRRRRGSSHDISVFVALCSTLACKRIRHCFWEERPYLATILVGFCRGLDEGHQTWFEGFGQRQSFPSVKKCFNDLMRIRFEEQSCTKPSKRRIPDMSDCVCEHAHEITDADSIQLPSSCIQEIRKGLIVQDADNDLKNPGISSLFIVICVRI